MDGIIKINQLGGKVIVQSPDDAEIKIMPQAAIETGCVDYIVNANKIAHMANSLL